MLITLAFAAVAGMIDDGGLVEVRGTLAAGRALAIIVGDEITPALGPARVPLVFRRRHRL